MILPPNHLALKGCLRPPAMAIGDSMFNGVRSLTIHDEMVNNDAFRMLGFSKLSTFKELGRSLGVGLA